MLKIPSNLENITAVAVNSLFTSLFSASHTDVFFKNKSKQAVYSLHGGVKIYKLKLMVIDGADDSSNSKSPIHMTYHI